MNNRDLLNNINGLVQRIDERTENMEQRLDKHGEWLLKHESKITNHDGSFKWIWGAVAAFGFIIPIALFFARQL